jgi:glycosyltransferase 2 family protein
MPHEGGAVPQSGPGAAFTRISPNRGRSFLYIGVAIVVGLVTNIVIGMLMDSGKILKTLSSVSIWLILLPFLAYMSVSVVDALRTYAVSRKSRYPVGMGTCLLNSFVGAFFSHITPLAVGGQPFQIYHLSRHGMPSTIATNIIFSRFVVNALILVVILVVGIPDFLKITTAIGGVSAVFYLGISVTFIFAIFFLAVLVQPRIVSWLSSFLARTRAGRLLGRLIRKPDWQQRFERYTLELRAEVRFLWSEGLLVMAGDILLNLASLTLQGFALWYPLWVLVDHNLPLLQVVVTYIAVWQVAMYIPSPGASGGLEGLFTLIFSAMSGRPEMALVAVVVWRFSTYYLSLVPGIILSGVALKMPAHGPVPAPSAAEPSEP